MTEDTAPDQVPGAPHPRDTAQLFGQAAAEAQFLDAFTRDRLHHGWLLTGPKGTGKATLAWRIARFLLATPPVEEDGLFGAPPPPRTLDIDPEHPVARRMAARAEGGLAAVTRSVNEDTGRLRSEIVVDDIRRLHRFFGLSAPDGGRRVVIVDPADEMNTSAANALLKMLEEPPARTTLLLIAHQPSRLLPTIRSRCRTLRLKPLDGAAMARALAQAGAEVAPGEEEALAVLAAGSVGAAIRLIAHDGLALYAALVQLAGTLPRLDRQAANALAESLTPRTRAERFDLFLDLADILLVRLAMTGATGAPPQLEAAPGEGAILARLAPDPQAGRRWAEAAAHISARVRHGAAVNLDPGGLVLDTVMRIQETARG
ncbi:DNA polymerase III subunit delta' [Seohaeicola nanhaiensis]|uniref:DNA polymerase III subunit delta n=1 Tax=Seohaeicola nanhaiensis TaxID=1387282 RepID=A0ABV9KDN4_9RHOB